MQNAVRGGSEQQRKPRAAMATDNNQVHVVIIRNISYNYTMISTRLNDLCLNTLALSL